MKFILFTVFVLYDENNEIPYEDVEQMLNQSKNIYFIKRKMNEIRNLFTRNQDKSGRTRRNEVVNDPTPRPLRVVTIAFIVAVSWLVNGISIPCSTVNSVVSIVGEKSLIKKKNKDSIDFFNIINKITYSHKMNLVD